MTDQEIIQAACDHHGVDAKDFPAKATPRHRTAKLARRRAAWELLARGHTKAHIAALLGYSGPTPVRYLINGKI